MPRTTFALAASLKPGDLVATFDSADSRTEALLWLETRASHRIRVNLDILTIATIRVDEHRTLTSIRIGGTL
jgi:hypothetical protein